MICEVSFPTLLRARPLFESANYSFISKGCAILPKLWRRRVFQEMHCNYQSTPGVGAKNDGSGGGVCNSCPGEVCDGKSEIDMTEGPLSETGGGDCKTPNKDNGKKQGKRQYTINKKVIDTGNPWRSWKICRPSGK